MSKKISRTSTDEVLVKECLSGNQAGWNALVEKYKNLVYSVPMKYPVPQEDAADIFQAVWTDLFNELGNLRKVGALRSWLVRTALHKCYHWKERRQRSVEINLDELPEVADESDSYLALA